MKYLDEYRAADAAQRLLDAVHRTVTKPWVLMEVCGGQTHAIVKYGLDALLPAQLELAHGPGCPVCVTPLQMLDQAHAIAPIPEVIFCSYGDMLRVPGSHGDLLTLKSRGADVRIVYSPLDAVRLAEMHPTREVVFFAVGFETTAPANAMAARIARKRGIKNFSLLVSHVLVPPALTWVMQAADTRVQGFLGPGHVCAVMGLREYRPIAAHYQVPIVITGFEPVDLLAGILRAVQMLEAGAVGVENLYGRAVSDSGNKPAQELLAQVFTVCDKPWRGIGVIPKSGYRLSYAYRDMDAAHRFRMTACQPQEPAECISGQILKGMKKPPQCSAFATRCTPMTPLGATMVSTEGACAAYYNYVQPRVQGAA